MNNRAKKIVSLFLALVMLVGMIPASSAKAAEDAGNSAVTSTKSENDFVLVDANDVATILVDGDEEEPVKRVVEDLQKDINSVTGKNAKIKESASGPVVIVGTLDNSAKIKEFIKNGTITKEEAAAIEGEWEAYLIKVVDKDTLVIAGSDNRGAIYGVYKISEEMGVSPWHYFADVPVQTKTEIYIPAGTVLTDKPDVQYRGLFINDEEKLYQWVNANPELAYKNASGTYQFGPAFYEKLFELILRLGGNYFWPAMHMVGFNNTPENIPVLQKYGVVFGTSHCDMLGRTNKHEWNSWCASKGYNLTLADWDYTVHKDKMIEYWTEGVNRHKDSDVQWTVGLRGNSDEPMIANNLQAYMTDAEKANPTDAQSVENAKTRVLIDAMKEQYKILKSVLGEKEAEKAFKVFVPYKEVLPLYNNQIFQDFLKSEECFEFTTMWCNDNHGMVRNTPNAEEREREGGNALYYHLSYWAPKDQSYMWMSSLPLATLGEELSKSWETGIQKAWILNVGDLKPAEGELDYFMRCGWDIDYTSNAIDFSTEWMLETFGNQVDLDTADEIADILNTFYHHSNVRKVEHMKLDVFEQTNFNEWDKRMATSQDLYDRAETVASVLAGDAKDAFYELVQSKINWTYFTNKMFYYADKSNLAYDQGKMASADTFSKLSVEADEDRKAEIEKYSTIVNGKWDGFIDPENYDQGNNFAGPPVTTQSPATSPAIKLGAAEMGAVVQGEEMPKTTASELTFSRYNHDGKFVDIFNKGAGEFGWTATASETWVKLSKESGTVYDEERIWVTVSDFDAAAGKTATITIAAGNVTKTINVVVENVEAGITDRYVEADGYVSMQAEHYTTKSDAGNKTWQFLENAGRGYDGDMMRTFDSDLGMVDEANISESTSPYLSYDFYLTSAGEFDLEVYRLPTLNATGKVRFAVSVDDKTPILVESTATDEGTSAQQNPQWAENLYHQIEKHIVELPSLSAGNHTLKLWMVDNFISIDKMVIYTNGIPESELGPDESYHSSYNAEFTESISTLDEINKTAATEKDLTEGWGTGNFVELGGKVSIEAEYAMENVLVNSSEVTADMGTYTLSHADVTLPEHLERNAWRFTQSDTGYGVYSPDLGDEWPTSNPDFRKASPELVYKIDFTTPGYYYVWARVRTVDYDGEGFYFSEDQKEFGGWISDYWTHNTDEKWTWVKVTKGDGSRFFVETANSTHSYHIWMREDGIAIDRIFMTLNPNEVPTDDTWSASLRRGSATEELFALSLENKKNEINKFSYPIGTTVGCYSQEKYTDLQNAIASADILAGQNEITEQQASSALAAIDTAHQALKNSLNLTDNGKTYLFYRDFEKDTAGNLFPFGLDTFKIDGSGDYQIVKEGEETFLRLTTGASAGNTQMIVPYNLPGIQQNERLVIEFKARMAECAAQDANLWVAMNGSDKPTVTTLMLNNDASKSIVVKKSGSESKNVGTFTSDTWKTYKVVVDMWQHHYDVYVDGQKVCTSYPYRTDFATENWLTGHRFGINNKANGSIDFDNIKVSIVEDPATLQVKLINDLNAKKTSMNLTSYTVGTAIGNYPQDKYTAVTTAINEAETLAQSDDITTAKATAALAKIDTAYAALVAARITEIELVKNDFESDTVGQLPSETAFRADTANTGTIQVAQETGNKFLKFATDSTKKMAQMYLDYSTSQMTDKVNQRLVVEFSARYYQNNSEDVNSWIAVKGDTYTKATTMLLAKTGSNSVESWVKTDSNSSKIATSVCGEWITYKIVVNFSTKKYDVYVNGSATAAVTDYDFRQSVDAFTGHRFGINNKASVQADFDDFRVTIKEVQ